VFGNTLLTLVAGTTCHFESTWVVSNFVLRDEDFDVWLYYNKMNHLFWYSNRKRSTAKE